MSVFAWMRFNKTIHLEIHIISEGKREREREIMGEKYTDIYALLTYKRVYRKDTKRKLQYKIISKPLQHLNFAKINFSYLQRRENDRTDSRFDFPIFAFKLSPINMHVETVGASKTNI